jgi:hypothetical protein
MVEKSTWTVETLKEHFEDILADKDAAVKASFDASITAMNKVEARLNEILDGFPQEYCRRSDFEELEKQINAIKADHVRREEFSDLKDSQAAGRGARTAVTAVMGIVVALIAVALGSMYANQLTNTDVSSQIERESPWAQDRPEIENELKALEKQILVLQTKQVQHEATDRLRAALQNNK